ncbi:MAG: dTMP kinase [Candidatus Treponema excrementipullorum]|nr:dTMP kinase [Spirochaetia bacterium]MDD7011424.1 dTMP kinase [Candidatus Treponema excrementipullorum]MCI6953301.1 dTMP kinase [Spirochaetia bacterium]MCI7588433.1 dTMP kinase [Spirochaetia bacterium]MDY2756068.1 dTMP kinase [Candidatus Treponema excrementipullorum]
MILKNFIVLEGIDGAGTSTQLDLLKNRLSPEKTVYTAEPTTLSTGRFLRSVLRGDEKLTPETTAFLFAADRQEHVYGSGGIVESCTSGKLVISDRYVFSSLAYQSITCGEELPRKLNQDFPLPEYLFFFGITPQASLKRIEKRDVTEIYEKKDFLEATARQYEKIISYYETLQTGMHIIRLDATESIEKLSEKIWTVLQEMPILQG